MLGVLLHNKSIRGLDWRSASEALGCLDPDRGNSALAPLPHIIPSTPVLRLTETLQVVSKASGGDRSSLHPHAVTKDG